MKKRFLRLKTAMKAVMLILMMGVVGITEGQESKANITFADANVKTLCVANWDTNGDGELSYAEAAAVKSLGVFENNTSITSFDELQYFTGLTTIGVAEFNNCSSLASIVIPSNVTGIYDRAFGGCTGLTTVYWNAVNVTSYSIPVYSSHHQFAECTNLTTVVFGENVETIPHYAFYECSGLTSLTIGSSVTTISDNAFWGCTGLTTVYWNAVNVTSYPTGSNPFDHCTNFEVIFGESVESIPNYAFYECSGLTGSLTIPNSITSIGRNAFDGCSGLTGSLEIPNSVTNIGNYAFQNCSGFTSLTIGNSITTIGNNVFSGCSGLTSLTIGNAVTNIGSSAFTGCNKLTGALIIPNSVTSIGSYAFYRCFGLTSLIIGNSVTTIGESAFNQCNSVTSLSIGRAVTSISNYAFSQCNRIASMTVFANTPPTLGTNSFNWVSTTIPVTVLNGSLNAYQIASGWSNFTNYQPMVDASITGYGSSTDSDHWVFIASPLATSVLPTAVDGLVAYPEENYDLYRFNQSGENGEWENYKGHTSGFVLENSKGYLYANKNNVTLTFVGTLNMTASQEVELDYDGTANMSGWNLIGNPFTEAAYIDRPYYKMNATGTDVTPVETYGTTPVAAYSGIVVHAETSGESVTFTKSGSKSSDNGGLQITLSKAGVRGDEAQDKVIVSFNKYAQLSKFIFNEDNAKLYIPMGGEDYAIAYSDRQSNMPLYFKTKEMGIYTMSFEGAIDNVKIIDNIDGSVIDLNAEKSFTFVGTPSDRNDRFTIVFNTPYTDDFAYQSGEGIVVNGEGELQVFDIMGRTVAKYYVNGLETVYIPCHSGVYVLRLLGKETKTQKIVVK